MSQSLRQLVVPIFLLLCLVFGGSSQSVWGTLVLQVLAIFIIAWAAVHKENVPTSAGAPLIFLIVALLLVLVQLVPLPPAVWTGLPGRDLVAQGYRALGQQLPWLPISSTPYDTLAELLFLLVPTAVVVAVMRSEAYRASWVAGTLFAGTVAAILLSYVQITSGESGHSLWYFYDITNLGSAVGFFASRNHMGTLLVVTLPFLVALCFGTRDLESRRLGPMRILGAAGLLIIFLGIALNGSLAAVALAVPVTAASALLVPSLKRYSAGLAAVAAVAFIAGLVLMANSSVQPKLTGQSTSSFEGRWEIWRVTAAAVAETFPVGTGLGSFEQIYGAMEPPQNVTRFYVNHAHNDYMEVLLEAGLADGLFILSFLVWWGRQAVRIFASRPKNRFAAAAVIASGAVLTHSMVDYPLRTAAIAAVFAFCIALMSAGPRRTEGEGRGADLRPPRHVVIG